MTDVGRFARLVLIVILTSVLMASQTGAEVSCHQINAKGAGQDLGGGATEGHVLGGGLLHGTTAGSFVITGISGTVASIAGTVTFTTANQSTVTVTVAGFFDVATGEFSASGPITDATGKLSGATGSLSFDGLQDLSDGSFVQDITGEICVDLTP